MTARKTGLTQVAASAKAAMSERSAREIEKNNYSTLPKLRDWRTRSDPLESVWATEIVPLLQATPELSPLTLLEYLQSKYEGAYADTLLRTMQRRVKQWKALSGAPKDIIFRQQHEPGRQGLSDFTELKHIVVIINGEPYSHLLYHFRLAYSGWSYVKVISGGESFAALAEGLQDALWRLGGCPYEHRTDSLSAAFKNLTADEQLDNTERYQAFCQHYNMVATRNNRGVSHENGSIESPHHHVKRRIQQAFLMRGSYHFESELLYQKWLDDIIRQHNRRHVKLLEIERQSLQALPAFKTADFTEIMVRVSSASTIDVRKVTYTVPSRLEGERLRVHCYDNRLACYLGCTHVITLNRVYPIGKTQRARCVDYRHVIHSLVKKPQAFRYSQLREHLLPNSHYQFIWKHVDTHMLPRLACKFIVGLLAIAAKYDCEAALAATVLRAIANAEILSLAIFQQPYTSGLSTTPLVTVRQHSLASYNELLPRSQQELTHA
jgi:hypothetical protein